MSTVSTHILDTGRGEPAAGVPVRLQRVSGPASEELGRAVTDADGRVTDFGTGQLAAGTYRLVFDTAAAAADGLVAFAPFFPEVIVTFTTDGVRPHYHVPLLLSAFGYATYRGS
jgi:5-hydroxyisourate hydrolase